MDMSNKSLALLLIAAIVISIGGTMISLNKLAAVKVPQGTPFKIGTGLAVGQVNLTLGNLTACNVDKSVNFGAGNPTATVTLSTDTASGVLYGFTDCSTGGTDCGDGIQINNTGNVRLNVSFSSSDNASTFLGDGTSAAGAFMYKVVNGTYKTGAAKSCTAGTLGSTSFANLVQSTNYSICSNMTPDMGSDILSLGFNLTLNESTPKAGTKTDNITIYCSQS